MVTDTRRCDQCGNSFTPQREHARFCSARCRVNWNQQYADADHTPVQAETLEWSVAGMWQATERLGHVPRCDRKDGFTIIGEAVWWVTMVDATLVRYRTDAYTELLDGLTPSEREVTEDTFGGLRFVRNRMTYDELSAFIRPVRPGLAGAAALDGAHAVSNWTWLTVPEPVAPTLTVRGKQWEMSRYRSYQAQLAGRPVGQTFDRATEFLRRVFTPSELHGQL
jgi:endogenous inhibitor of DNA gyrase (YacG/DUF329 family)